MDCLVLMFPPSAVCHNVTLKNVRLSQMQGQDNMNVGEFWEFIGLPLIIAWLDFASHCDLWLWQSLSMSPPNICPEIWRDTEPV